VTTWSRPVGGKLTGPQRLSSVSSVATDFARGCSLRLTARNARPLTPEHTTCERGATARVSPDTGRTAEVVNRMPEDPPRGPKREDRWPLGAAVIAVLALSVLLWWGLAQIFVWLSAKLLAPAASQ
jgi:hypothetical protein